jgi:hypothetical protein
MYEIKNIHLTNTRYARYDPVTLYTLTSIV